MTPPWLFSLLKVISLPTDKRSNSCVPGAVHNHLLPEARETVELAVGFKRSPLHTPRPLSASAALWFLPSLRLPGYHCTQGGLRHRESGAEDVLSAAAGEVHPVLRSNPSVTVWIKSSTPGGRTRILVHVEDGGAYHRLRSAHSKVTMRWQDNS